MGTTSSKGSTSASQPLYDGHERYDDEQGETTISPNLHGLNPGNVLSPSEERKRSSLSLNGGAPDQDEVALKGDSRGYAHSHDGGRYQKRGSSLNVDTLSKEVPGEDFDDAAPLLREEDGSLLASLTDAERTGTPLSSVFNLSSTILGASGLSMPYACQSCGIPLFLAMLLVVCFMAEASVRMLVDGMKIARRLTYAGIGNKAAGKFGKNLALVTVLLQQLGANTSFVKIIGTVMHPVVSGIDGAMSNV
eukprot:gb/GECG01016599.1/.p1 GENE.gb/GECG01016599.1/~~gb/GECG01016599.1/.p1  ORF type:complete len:249 (+),score=25.62 gb/GECG01016599.1/:1-747(+)